MEENEGEKEKKEEVINDEIISNNKKKAENLQTKKSLLSIDNPQDYENSLDLERKVIEESPKGRFQRFEEELGSGSQKRVFLAYDTDTGCEVAWNSVLVDIKDSDSIQKIKVEIEILKPLKHPNIINFIYCFFNEEKSEIVFITELFSGGSLAQHLMEFKYPRLKLVKLWCQEILKGLKYLHEHNPPIIHRDIKCENIFINKNTGEVKIGDLGLGIILKDTEYASQFCGTIEYCSPEVYQKKYGVKCDIYSLGISIIEIITGEKPYSECKGKILSICDRVKNGILPECFRLIKNEKVKKFILKCLKPENERPSANELLQDEFLNDLDSEENNYPAIDVSNKYRMNSFKSLGYLLKESDKNEMILDDISSGEIKSNFTYNYKNDTILCKNKTSIRDVATGRVSQYINVEVLFLYRIQLINLIRLIINPLMIILIMILKKI
jgi:WNK lysine deficient protein kinase